ncbi:MAG: F0F1 ATP synthase subunit A [Actinomycetota bacterium]
MTTTMAPAGTATAPPKKKGGKLIRVAAVIAISVGIVYLVDAIVGFGPKTFHAPTVDELFEFKPIFTVAGLEVTFPTIVMFVMTFLLIFFFVRAFSKPTLVPKGSQNVAEAGVDFIREQIALATIGPEGHAWVPFLTAIFFWVLANNFMSIFPFVQFPVTSRMAYPVTLAITSWFIFNFVGIRKQGFFGYFKGIMFPPGVPIGINYLLAFIELFSTVIVRPITLSVRLFANMVAGHMILGVLFVASSVFIAGGFLGRVGFIAPFGLSIALMGLELFVIAMQAFIFTILTAVYIGGALHPEH